MTQEHQNRHCSDPNCEIEVMEIDSNIVHLGGGEMMQKCQNCGFVGGQVGRFSQCPRCGDQTSLVDDHRAI